MNNCSRCDGPVRESTKKAFEVCPVAVDIIHDAPDVCVWCLLEVADSTAFNSGEEIVQTLHSGVVVSAILDIEENTDGA